MPQTQLEMDSSEKRSMIAVPSQSRFLCNIIKAFDTTFSVHPPAGSALALLPNAYRGVGTSAGLRGPRARVHDCRGEQVLASQRRCRGLTPCTHGSDGNGGAFLQDGHHQHTCPACVCPQVCARHERLFPPTGASRIRAPLLRAPRSWSLSSMPMAGSKSSCEASKAVTASRSRTKSTKRWGRCTSPNRRRRCLSRRSS